MLVSIRTINFAFSVLAKCVPSKAMVLATCVPRIEIKAIVLVMFLAILIAPHWMVLRSYNVHHSAHLEMPVLMVSLFAGIVLISFWPKPLVYSPWF